MSGPFITENNVSGLSNVSASMQRASDGAWWNVATPGWEAYSADHIANYSIPMSESPASSGIYTFTNPDPGTPATYQCQVQASASLVVSDLTTGLFAGGEAGPITLPTTVPTGYGPGAAGAGAYAITITITDADNNPLQNVSVRATINAGTMAQFTNSSGQVVFNCDDGVFNVGCYYPFYQFASGQTFTVSGAAAAFTFAMTATTITPSATNFTTGYALCYQTGNATPVAGQTVTTQLVATPVGWASLITAQPIQSATSNSGGVVQWADMIPGATYQLKFGATTTRVQIPLGAGAEYQFSDLLIG